jgi:hypothetical protein
VVLVKVTDSSLVAAALHTLLSSTLTLIVGCRSTVMVALPVPVPLQPVGPAAALTVTVNELAGQPLAGFWHVTCTG